jgi:hypothetical protein
MKVIERRFTLSEEKYGTITAHPPAPAPPRPAVARRSWPTCDTAR